MSTTLEYTLLNHRKAALLHLAARAGTHQPDRARLADEALRRIEAGIYGYCGRCGIKIPEAALERRPERAGCSECDPD